MCLFTALQVCEEELKGVSRRRDSRLTERIEPVDRKFMEDKSMVDLLADVADDTSATKTAIADHKAAKAAFLSNLGF